MATFVVAALLVGTPAAVLRLLCVGDSCATTAEASAETPFCSLPQQLRASITGAVRDGRSGELLAVTRRRQLAGGSVFGDSSPAWPSLEGVGEVPIVLSGAGVREGVDLPADAGLKDVAPTVARILHFERRHDEVRSGEVLKDAVESGPSPRLVVVVALKGVGSDALVTRPGSWPTLRRMMERGAATLEGATGSVSSDPAGPLTTLGTGGLPSEHGMTGTLVRNEERELASAWGPRSPINVIATLAEDLDEDLGQDPVVGLVGSAPVDRGMIGGAWYVEHDKDEVTMLPEGSSPARLGESASAMLRRIPLGEDEVPDLLAVALEGRPRHLDASLSGLLEAVAEEVGPDALVVVAGTGDYLDAGTGILDAGELLRRLERRIPGRPQVVEAVSPGELFLDQEVLAEQQLSADVVLEELLGLGDDGVVFADAFPSLAVTFGRFC